MWTAELSAGLPLSWVAVEAAVACLASHPTAAEDARGLRMVEVAGADT
jgi:hypothetical protein